MTILPFSNLENESDFMSAMNDSPSSGSLRYLSDKILQFELNDSNHQYESDNVGPDRNYYMPSNKYIRVAITV